MKFLLSFLLLSVTSPGFFHIALARGDSNRFISSGFCFVFVTIFRFLCLCIWERDAFCLEAEKLVLLSSSWFWTKEISIPRVYLVLYRNLFYFMFLHDILIRFLWELRRGKRKYDSKTLCRPKISFVLRLICILGCASRTLNYYVWSFELSLNAFKSVFTVQFLYAVGFRSWHFHRS